MMAEKDDAWPAHARLIPLIHSCDPAHISDTVEEIVMAVEFLAQQADIRVRDFWPLVRRRVAERKDAEYHAMFARDAEERERRAQCKVWLPEIGKEVLKDLIIVPAQGRPVSYNQYQCSICKEKFLDGDDKPKKYIEAKFRYQQFSLATKAELIRCLRSELTQPNTSTYLECKGCGNPSSDIRFLAK